MTRFVGIAREPVFSPGRVDDDFAILRAVAHALRRQGHSVELLRGDDAEWPAPDPATLVFAMAQGEAALARLQRWEEAGVRIVNAPAGILNCQRHRAVPALQAAGVPFPRSVLSATDDVPRLPLWIDEHGAWVKRGDVHATQADDVTFAENDIAVRAALERFAARAVRRAVVQQHVAGTVVKFYAVRGGFFRCRAAETAVSVPVHAIDRMRAVGARAAEVLGVEVYGGDCVFADDGTVALIDLNDWPSYAPCRAEAAEAIAAYLHARGVASRR